MNMQTNLATHPRTVTSKEAQRQWKVVTDKALKEPVIITAHGRPRHVLMSYEDYEQMRRQERQAYAAADMPLDLANAILSDISALRAPDGRTEDGDTLID